MKVIKKIRDTEQFPEMERVSENFVNFYFDHSERPYGEGIQYMAVVVEVEYPAEEGKEDDLAEVKALALPTVKEYRIGQIDAYDKSDNVNSFSLGAVSMWLTVDERQQLATQISANEAVGRESMSKWFGGQEFSFPIAAWKQMLVALEVYAGDALNVTEMHTSEVAAIEDTDEAIAYDFTQGYPEKLVFPYVGPTPQPDPEPEPEPTPDPEPTPEPDPEPSEDEPSEDETPEETPEEDVTPEEEEPVEPTEEDSEETPSEETDEENNEPKDEES